MTQQQPWSERLAQGVARELRRHRERRGMSAQELAAGCAALGAPIQRSVIANFENGRRASIGVAELLTFAAVLKIPPVWLIAPMGFEPQVEILPGEMADPYACAAWIGGGNAQDGEEEIYCDNPVPLSDDLLYVLGQIEECSSQLDKIKVGAESVRPELEELEERYARLRREFDQNAQKQREVLERVKAMSTEERSYDSTGEMLQDTEKLYERMTQCSDEMEEIISRKSELGQASRGLEQYLKWLTEYERDARELLSEFKQKGWLPPKLPEHLTYLLEDPKRETALQVSGRRRRRAT